MSGVVLDASAVLAVLLQEPGCEMVIAELDGAHLGAVNLGEVLSRLSDGSMPTGLALDEVLRFRPTIHVFNQAMAALVGDLRPRTKALGLSFGDRACLALARTLGMPVLTSDRRLAEAATITGLDIRLIR